MLHAWIHKINTPKIRLFPGLLKSIKLPLHLSGTNAGIIPENQAFFVIHVQCGIQLRNILIHLLDAFSCFVQIILGNCDNFFQLLLFQFPFCHGILRHVYPPCLFNL